MQLPETHNITNVSPTYTMQSMCPPHLSGLPWAHVQVSRPSRAGLFVAAGSILTEEQAAAATVDSTPVSPDTTPFSSPSSLAAAAAAERALSSSTSKPGSSKWVIDENELLKSTLEHRLWTFGCMGLLSVNLLGAASEVHGVGDAGTAVLAVFAAYVLSDLGTAVYHWGVDNYGDGSTPVFGRQIAAFQGHHQRPWTITQREFCNNVHQVGFGLQVPVPASSMLFHKARGGGRGVISGLAAASFAWLPRLLNWSMVAQAAHCLCTLCSLRLRVSQKCAVVDAAVASTGRACCHMLTSSSHGHCGCHMAMFAVTC